MSVGPVYSREAVVTAAILLSFMGRGCAANATASPVGRWLSSLDGYAVSREEEIFLLTSTRKSIDVKWNVEISYTVISKLQYNRMQNAMKL